MDGIPMPTQALMSYGLPFLGRIGTEREDIQVALQL